MVFYKLNSALEMYWLANPGLDNQLIDGGKVVSPTHRPHFTLQNHFFVMLPVLISLLSLCAVSFLRQQSFHLFIDGSCQCKIVPFDMTPDEAVSSFDIINRTHVTI
jgi:hypothetical protein